MKKHEKVNEETDDQKPGQEFVKAHIWAYLAQTHC